MIQILVSMGQRDERWATSFEQFKIKGKAKLFGLID
jgi:hypothetical protein